MILVDTSIWIGHLRSGDATLSSLLENGRVPMNPMVRGELACGSLGNRTELLDLLGRLPQAPTATDEEALVLIDNHPMMGRGIGFIDVHLLASVALDGAARLWTADERLGASRVRWATAGIGRGLLFRRARPATTVRPVGGNSVRPSSTMDGERQGGVAGRTCGDCGSALGDATDRGRIVTRGGHESRPPLGLTSAVDPTLARVRRVDR